jgi:hypothetical protein
VEGDFAEAKIESNWIRVKVASSILKRMTTARLEQLNEELYQSWKERQSNAPTPRGKSAQHKAHPPARLKGLPNKEAEKLVPAWYKRMN